MPCSRLATLAVAGLSALIATSAGAQNGARPRADATLTDSMAVSTEWLAAHLNDPNVVVVEVTMNDSARTERIPGSRAVMYRRLTVARDGISTELPTVDSLKALFEGLGISDNKRVVVYAHEAPMATRMLMTLDYLGHTRVSYLDGGYPKWAAEKRPAGTSDSPVMKGTLTPAPACQHGGHRRLDRIEHRQARARADRHAHRRRVQRHRAIAAGCRVPGHLAGARQLEWQSLFQTENPLLLKDRAELRAMFGERAKDGDAVVTYCWVGYRASATYFGARLLGLDAKFYDGSYQDWQVRKLPTTAGATP